MSWMDFSTAEEQQNSFELIPNRTPAKVRLKIRPGGYNDPAKGWTGGYATRKDASGAVYLDAEFTIIGGKFNKRKVWSLIGLHSPKGPNYENMGRSFIRAALESARGIKADDMSDAAIKARQISGFADLDGLEFVAMIEVAPAKDGYDAKNEIKAALGVSHKDYRSLMDGTAPAEASAPAAQKPALAAVGGGAKPAWLD